MLTAADIMDCAHPLNKAFVAYCKGKGCEPSKRQARQFLKRYPQYQTIKAG